MANQQEMQQGPAIPDFDRFFAPFQAQANPVNAGAQQPVAGELGSVPGSNQNEVPQEPAEDDAAGSEPDSDSGEDAPGEPDYFHFGGQNQEQPTMNPNMIHNMGQVSNMGFSQPATAPAPVPQQPGAQSDDNQNITNGNVAQPENFPSYGEILGYEEGLEDINKLFDPDFQNRVESNTVAAANNNVATVAPESVATSAPVNNQPLAQGPAASGIFEDAADGQLLGLQNTSNGYDNMYPNDFGYYPYQHQGYDQDYTYPEGP